MAESTHFPSVLVYHGSNSKPISVPLHNYNIHTPPKTTGNSITLAAPPKTDLWRKPPTLNVSTAPTAYTRVPLSKFRSARVTATAAWNTLYDQGGLVLFLGPPPGEKGETKGQWVKTGIEFVFEKPHVGTVAADRWSDWSLAEVPASGIGADGKTSVTIELEREASLWIYKVDPATGERAGIREITWVFEEDTPAEAKSKGVEEESKKAELWVGVYTARPTVPTGQGRESEELEVRFEGFEIKLFD
ncbi:hypothetical protein BDZ91DRAFT_721419 [Kalaharituber pfeilii]|nr:hypothetical protein BDZ91DRAFT_721419 [Kalaharituber pfeilii]